MNIKDKEIIERYERLKKEQGREERRNKAYLKCFDPDYILELMKRFNEPHR